MIDKAQSPEESGRTETEQVQEYAEQRLRMALLMMTVTGEIGNYDPATIHAGTQAYAERLVGRWMSVRAAVNALGAA